jgi:antitoxin (DNA-binding transcriptional repressor) of toxin-antitoxin stability system
MLKQQVDIHELARRLPSLLAAMAEGEEVVLTQGERPIARLIRIKDAQPDRRPGSAAGLFTLSPNFNEPLDHFDQHYQ